MRKRHHWILPLGLIVAGLFLIAVTAVNQPSSPWVAWLSPSPTAEPIVPTRTPAPTLFVTDTAAPSPERPTATPSPPPARSSTATPLATATATQSPTAILLNVSSLRSRFGISAPVTAEGGSELALAALSAGLPFGSLLNWNIDPAPPSAPGITFWQMVRVSQDGIRDDWDEIDQAIQENPGSVWVVGNEPDVSWQDNVTPDRYALIYHDVYDFIKSRDPAARIAVAGVAQPTPLRLAYLDMVLNTYRTTFGQPMPIDIWTVHAFILREEADSWGVGIPPGMAEAEVLANTEVRLYDIEDHNDIDVFRQYVLDFRAWMAARGYADRPLAVTEYGILMPADYGFPPPVVADFMTQTFDFFLTAANETGYAADQGRLVQRWFWYSLYDEQEYYPTGNLYDPETNTLTHVGQVFTDYVNDRVAEQH